MHPDALYFIILPCLTPDNFTCRGGGGRVLPLDGLN
jgi:hypothetical protein